MTANNKHTLFLTGCGGISSLCDAPLAGDIVRSCLLAATGTIVSFLLTLVLKRFGKRK
jgi:hypothetical protein